MNLIRKLAIVLVALGSVSVAQADLITFEYRGDITEILDLNGVLDGSVKLGGKFKGEITLGN